MFDLQLEPWIVGDSATLAAWENDQEEKVYQMIDFFNDDRWTFITAEDIDEAMENFDIDYLNLPQYLKDLIDKIDIV